MVKVYPQIKIWEQEPGIIGVYKQIEKAGRVCYQSVGNTPEAFFNKVVKDGHLSVLRHGTIYLTVPFDAESIINFYIDDPYSYVYCGTYETYITTNMQVIVDNKRQDDLMYMTSPAPEHEKRVTVDIICSIGISREFNSNLQIIYVNRVLDSVILVRINLVMMYNVVCPLVKMIQKDLISFLNL